MHNASMRTTFTPEPDVADRIHDLAKNSKRSLNAVLNDLVRSALNREAVKEANRQPYKVETFKLKLRPGLDPVKMSQILADLDEEEL